jgi:hypothetical protein
MTPKSRWLAYVLAGALVMVSVAAVAYAIGVSNRSNNAAPAAQSTSIPANPGMGQGGMGQGGMGQGGFGQGGNRGQVAPTASGTVTAVGSSSVTISQAARRER